MSSITASQIVELIQILGPFYPYHACSEKVCGHNYSIEVTIADESDNDTDDEDDNMGYDATLPEWKLVILGRKVGFKRVLLTTPMTYSEDEILGGTPKTVDAEVSAILTEEKNGGPIRITDILTACFSLEHYDNVYVRRVELDEERTTGSRLALRITMDGY